jgi:lysophospholipase L1-like esterase
MTLRKTLAQAAAVLAITALSFVSIEFLIATFWPQASETVATDGGPVGRVDSVLGYRYRQGVRAIHRSPEFDVEYEINAEGLRDAGYPPALESPASTRILLLGDSFTFGQGTDYDRIWPTLFEEALRVRGYSVDVVNAGIQGYSTRDEVLFLEKILPRFSPDMVVLVFLANDLYANEPLESEPPLNPSTQTRRRPGLRRVQGADGLQTVMLAQRWFAASDWLYLRLYALTPWIGYFRVPATPEFDAKVAITKDLLLSAKALCDANGVTLVVLSIPQQFQVLASVHRFGVPELDVGLADSTLAAFAAEEGITWINTLDGFAEQYRARRRNLYFRVDGHLNEDGNQLLATNFTAAFLTHFAADLERDPAHTRALRGEVDGEHKAMRLEP